MTIITPVYYSNVSKDHSIDSLIKERRYSLVFICSKFVSAHFTAGVNKVHHLLQALMISFISLGIDSYNMFELIYKTKMIAH